MDTEIYKALVEAGVKLELAQERKDIKTYFRSVKDFGV
jgi:hypothetical protein